MANNLSTNVAPVVTTGDPTTVNDATAVNQLGTILVTIGDTALSTSPAPKVWQYVQLIAGTTARKGMFVVWSNYNTFVVDGTTTITSALRNKGAGFLQGTSLSGGNFGWIQVG